MADKAIGSLVEATVINDADRFVLEQSGQAKQISGATMISELAEALDGHGGIQSIDLVSGDGNVKTYRITFTDGTTYDYEVHDGESGNYALVAGNLAPYSDTSGATQSIPFLSQGTGRGNGSATVSVGSYCQLKMKLGNTAGVNDLSNPPDASGVLSGVSYSITSRKVTISGTVSATNNLVLNPYNVNGLGLVGHKIYIPPVGGGAKAVLLNNIGGRINTTDGGIVEIPNTDTRGYAIRLENGNTIDVTNYACHFVDLTIWFGSNDRIPADLLSHPENWGRYYAGSLAHNAGALESADGTVLKSIGRNLFDKSKAVANSRWTSSGASSSAGTSRSDYIDAIPGAEYYFKDVHAISSMSAIYWFDGDKNFISAQSLTTTSGTASAPANARYVGINFPSNSLDIATVSLYDSGESGYSEYYPFTVLAEVDTGSEVLRGVEGSRDEKLPSGVIKRNRAVIDLGTLNYQINNHATLGQYFFAGVQDLGIKREGEYSSTIYSAICSKYVITKRSAVTLTNKSLCFDGSGSEVTQIQIKDSAYSTAADFKAAMSGVYLEYPLATPTTEQGTPFPENIPCNDFGSMYWTQTKGIPQGNEIFYPEDYKASIDALYNRVDGDMSRIVIDDDLADYNTKTEDESKFATKDAVGGTLRQLLASIQGLNFDDTVYVDLGNCSYSTNLTGTYTYEAFISSFDVPKANGISNFLCSGLTYKAYADNGEYGIRGYGSSGAMAIRVPISVASTPSGVKSLMKGVLLAYKKA